MRRLQLEEGTSSKFWEVECVDATLTVRWGRIGTAGQSKVKDFPTAEAARREHDKLLREKLGKGYSDVGEVAAPAPARPAPPAAAPPAPLMVEQPAAPPAPVPAASQTPPALDVVVWTDGARRLALPARGGASDPARGSIKSLYASIAARAKELARFLERGELDAGPHAALQRRVRESLQRPEPPDELELELEAAGYALLALEITYGDRNAITTDYVQYWLAKMGLPFAFEAWARAKQLGRAANGTSYTMTGLSLVSHGLQRHEHFENEQGFRQLRRHVAAASEADFQAVARVAERYRAGASALQRLMLGVAFGENSSWVEQDLLECEKSRGSLPYWQERQLAGVMSLAFGCLSDPAVAAKLLERFDPQLFFDGTASFDLVARLGVEAQVPLGVALAKRLQQESIPRDDVEKATRALQLIHSRSVGQLLAPLLERSDTRFAASDYFLNAPRVALEVLPERDDEFSRALLVPAVAAARPWLAPLEKQLAPAAWQRIQSALGSVEDVVEADDAELPAVLAKPPWRGGPPAPGALPKKMPALPPFFQPIRFARPRLREGDKALSEAAVRTLGEMLLLGTPEAPYPGVAVVKAACTPASLAAFAWDLFEAFAAQGYPSKEAWALRALGLLGDDECARRLTPLLRAWPGESAHQRAVVGLDVLAAIGTDVALMHLHGIAQKLKFKGLQDRARQKIDEIAAARGLTGPELADRLVPDLGLDEGGSLELDFGERRFFASFDQNLKPFVRDAQGNSYDDLPKPKKTDDPEKSAAAVERFKALKKDARTIASAQVLRCELSMCAQRRWQPEEFRRFFVEHPLIIHLVRRLVWGVFDDAGKLLQTFRVAEDSSFADQNDDALRLLPGRIGLCHALELGEQARKWGDVFADYEILQPFSQLGRDCYARTEQERAAGELKRWEGITTPTGKVLGLEQRGWRRCPAEDAGISPGMVKQLSNGSHAYLFLDPGIFTGYLEGSPEQKLQSVVLGRSHTVYFDQREALSIGSMSDVDFSELVRDVERLRS